jgi:hypothetical protein
MPFLTAKELSVQLRIPLARVYELSRRRLIPTVRLAERQLRYDPDALREWAARGGSVERIADVAGGKAEVSDDSK